jgi:HD-GYP domain-containing protein (c-di-GMP phosphodiesterase class II)
VEKAAMALHDNRGWRRAAPNPADAAPAGRPQPAHIVLEELIRTCPPRLAAHHVRVSRMSEALALRLGLDEEEARQVGHAGSLHDIGMAFLPQDLLDQPGLLSANEKEQVHRHSLWGHQLLDMVDDPANALAARVALEHHERWDGSGYPSQLAGEDICVAARIVAVCGVYDALRHPCPGKAPLAHEAALNVLRHGDERSRATAFDPAILAVFVKYGSELRGLAEDGDQIRAAA